jgi:uncharacterized protein (TIGR00159 family)
MGFSFFQDLAANFRVADMLDIFVTSVFLYFGLNWLRQRASRSLALAIGIIGALYVLSRALDMYLTSLLFHAGLVVVLVALVLIFHIDIRRAFESLATWDPFQRRVRIAASTRMLDTLAETLFTLASQRIGALVVLTGKESLDRHVRGGTPLNGDVSLPLIYSIFDPSSPGHDGALIIEENRIAGFGVHLPLSANLVSLHGGGTRHAAALGLSERSDAMAIAVSEEQGTVSIAHQGALERAGSPADLARRLTAFYQDISPPRDSRGRMRFLTRHFGVKSASVGLAALIWLLLGYRVETVHRTYDVPVEFRNLAPNWIIEDPRPTSVRVSMSGAQRNFDFDPGNLLFALDMSAIREGVQSMFITREQLVHPPGLSVHQVQPNVIRFRAYPMVSILTPVKPRFQGSLPEGRRLVTVTTEPDSIRLLVRQSRRSEIRATPTEPIDLGEVDSSITVNRQVVIPEFARVPEGAPTTVAVMLEIIPVK